VAFANGVAVAVNNQCDSYHMLTHPGVLIVPAGLATAEGEGRSGRELLTALVAGYEVQCRCARDFIPSTPAHGFRASPVYGILGCAATTAKLLGVDARGVGNAIALAASFAGSLIEGQRTGTRDADFAEAQAARSGMWAASLATQGFQGAPTALEGEGGFYNAFTGSSTGDLAYTFTGPPKADLGEIVADLGRRWEVLDVKFKVYPTPGFNQPVVWLAREVAARHKLVADEIEHVTLEMNYLETLYPSPRFPRPPAPDGSGFGRTAYMLAYTLIAGDYPVLEANVEDPRGRRGDRRAARRPRRRAPGQGRDRGAVGRECFAPRLTVTLRDGRRVAGEYHGRELMWDSRVTPQSLALRARASDLGAALRAPGERRRRPRQGLVGRRDRPAHAARLARAHGRAATTSARVGDPRHLRAHLGLGLARRPHDRCVAPASCKRAGADPGRRAVRAPRS
jgi:hypothetical protein